MLPGEVYWTYVPYRDGSGGKQRSFLVLHLDGESVFGLEGTGQERDELTRLFEIDRSRPEFQGLNVPSGHYYCEGARELSVAEVAAGSRRGRLTDRQLRRIVRELNAWLIRRNPPPGLSH